MSLSFRCSYGTQIVHLLVCWSSFLSWTLFLVDLLLIAFLSMHAYQDGEFPILGLALEFFVLCCRIGPMLTLCFPVDTLDHFEVPFFGPLANSFVDDE